ncbi:hypothetical protein HBA55_10220 [Pseudomaricurvus alkylphenolicus]|jgi:hypothetical protein|uniref:hypothetical protein n=1 Tax=Pseudomaricurvus alkylphenolicus TaxID=1306991 RepID=UPI00141EF8AB|nr:hypothetical protein [Pseudomaricurvus alkylphenolicus]NIB39963.1 hypothetical protein [Pseudomaricurvus alkylphenolicus]
MKKHIAVRLKSYYHAEAGFSHNGATVINGALEKRDPALRNITEELYNQGMAFDVDDCSLFWFQIEDDKPASFYSTFNEVELAFESDWLEEQKSRMRSMGGNMYYNACAEIARSFNLKDQSREIQYRLPTRAA